MLGGDVVYTFVNELIEPVDDKDSVVRIIDLYDAFKTSECYINMERVEKRKYGKGFFTNEVQKHIHFRKFYKERYEGLECKDMKGNNDKIRRFRNVLTNFKMIEPEI